MPSGLVGYLLFSIVVSGGYSVFYVGAYNKKATNRGHN